MSSCSPGPSLDEIRIVPQQIVRVTTRKNRGHELKPEFLAELFNALDGSKITRIHVPQHGELRVRQQNVRVARLGGTT